jgi:hypothetical protein
VWQSGLMDFHQLLTRQCQAVRLALVISIGHPRLAAQTLGNLFLGCQIFVVQLTSAPAVFRLSAQKARQTGVLGQSWRMLV